MLKKIFNRLKEGSDKLWVYPLFLLLVSLVSHREWFRLSSNLFFHDWRYRTNEAVAQIFPFGMSSWLSFSGLGAQNIQPYSFVPTFIWGLVGNYAIGSKISHFIPIAILSLLAPYFFFKRIAGNKHAAFLGALLYGFNTYLITRSFAHLPIAVVNALFPLIMLSFINFLDSRSWRNAILFALTFSFGCVYEVRVMYIACIALLVLSAVNTTKIIDSLKKDFMKWIAVILCAVSLNIFWVLTTLKAGTSAIDAVANRGIWGSELITILDTLSLSNWNWSLGSYETAFVLQPILPYLWVFPLISFASCLLIKRIGLGKMRYYLFAFTIAIVGITLSKQADVPFPGLYQWLYSNFPGFNLFREASKFNVLEALGYALLSVFTVTTIAELIRSKKIKYALFIIIASYSLINAKRLITQDAGATFVSRTEPEEYVELRELLKEDEGQYFRTLWVPFYHQWGYFDLLRPKLSTWELLSQGGGLAKFGSLPVGLANFKNPELYIGFMRLPYGKELLGMMNVKYVIVPKELPRSVENIFPYAGDRDDYTSALDTVNYLERTTIGGLDVFKNDYLMGHVFLFPTLLRFDSEDHLESKYNFSSKTIDADLLYSNDLQRVSPDVRTAVTDVFEGINFANINTGDGLVRKAISDRSGATLYGDRDREQAISFISSYGYYSARLVKQGDLVVGSSATSSPSIGTRTLLQKTWLGNTGELFVIKNKELYPLRQNKETLVQDVRSDSSVGIYRMLQNRIVNPSFESGSWQKSVGDCDKHDDNPQIAMRVDKVSKSDGRQSLSLEAKRHVACISQSVDLKDAGEYLFAVDYQSPNAKKFGYYLVFNDPKKTVIRDAPDVVDNNWHTYYKIIHLPAQATSVKVYLYSYSTDQETNIVTRYDNVRFAPTSLVKRVVVPVDEGYEKMETKIADGDIRLGYVDKQKKYANLLSNGSFEDGLWQKSVGDCNRYDGNGLISMSTTTHEKTDGEVSLELSAVRHTACTSISVPIKEGSSYLIGFDHQSPNAAISSYYVGFDDAKKTNYQDRIVLTDTAWKQFSKLIVAPHGATSMSLYLYARESDKVTNVINRYDNVKVVEVPDLQGAFYLVSEPERKLVQPSSITFDLINPTKKRVHIKGASTPFFLGMSESYHDQWQLQFNNAKVTGWWRGWSPFAKPNRIANDAHYKLDGFLNAWYVDTDELCGKQALCTKNADGTYDLEMVLEFWPQRWFYLGLLISGTTLAACLSYLGYDGARSLRRRYLVRKERKQNMSKTV